MAGRDLQVNNYFYSDPARASNRGTPSPAMSGKTGPSDRGHVFISYVREDSAEVDRLQHILEAAGIPVWRDKASLWPGEDWRFMIRNAITHDALVFIACFSRHSAARQKSYMNEELWLAIEQLRLRRPYDPWLIPVRFDDCDVPEFELSPGRTLASIQRADLFGASRDLADGRLLAAIRRQLGQPVQPAPSPNPDSPHHHKSAGYKQIWTDLATLGYALTSDESIRLPGRFRQNFRDAYFNSWTLRHNEGDRPVDRERARDVIRYQWRTLIPTCTAMTRSLSPTGQASWASASTRVSNSWKTPKP